MTEIAQLENVRMKINSLENGRKVTHWNITEKRHRDKYITVCDLFVIFCFLQYLFFYFPGVYFLPYSSIGFFFHIQLCAFKSLLFSRLCLFQSVTFTECFFYHFPVCEVSVILHAMHFQFCPFLGVNFLPFSSVCFFLQLQ